MSAVLAALPWLLLPVFVLLKVRRRPLLSDWPADAAPDAPLVSVIVPARNEGDNIGRCLEGLRASTYPRLEITVVDDESTDETAEVVRGHAARDSRVRLVQPGTPPPGWFGKPWACMRGAEVAGGEVLVFTDADVRHHPETVGRAVAALEDTGTGLLSALPHQDLPTFWERLIMPVVTLLILFRFPDPERVNRSPRTQDKLAVGGFLVCRRDAYQAVGGHGAVRHEVAEDLRLGQCVHAAGYPVHLLVADRFVSVRMYRSLGEIVEGWSKNLSIASRQTVPRWLRPATPWLIALWLVAVWVAPLAGIAIGMVTGSVGVVRWGALAFGVSALFFAAVYARLRLPLTYALLHPFGGLAAAAIVVRSALRGSRVTWKGRTYRTAAWAVPETPKPE